MGFVGWHSTGTAAAGFPLNWDATWAIAAVLPPAIFGVLFGLLLPRPRFLESGARTSALLWSTPPGSALRRLALLFHGAVLVRDVWHQSIAAGLHAYVLALWGWILGRGFALPAKQPQQPQPRTSVKSADGKNSVLVRQPSPSRPADRRIAKQSTDGWYVTEADLDFFKQHCEQNAPLEGATNWELQLERDYSTFSYSAWRRILPSGKAEYKSVTVSLDATAEEFTDFYLDDDVRPEWDGMVTHHDVVENGSPADRCQVVHWIRSFPFAFISDREYVIARRQWRDPNGCIYVMTKSVDHPRVPLDDSVVRMDVFYSMWRSRTVACPRDSGRPACETVLLHHEQFKIPENLARFAVKAGMGSFVKKIGPGVRNFVEARRIRVDPFEADPEAYGVKQMPRTASNASSLASTVGTEYTAGSSTTETDAIRYPQRAARRRRKPQPNGLQKLVTVGLGVAAVVVAVQTGRGLPKLLAAAAGAIRGRQQGQKQQRDLVGPANA